MENQLCGIRQGQRAAGIGGSHFTGTVTDHHLRVNSPSLEKFQQRALNRKNDRLRQPDFVELFLARKETGLAQRKIRMLAPALFDGVNHPLEYGICVIQQSSASGPLGALTCEYHGNSRRREILTDRNQLVALVFKIAQLLQQLLLTERRKIGSGGEMSAPQRKVPRKRIQIKRFGFEEFAQTGGALHQRIRRAGGKRNHVAGSRRQRHGPQSFAVRAVFCHDTVSIGPADAKRIDADDGRFVRKRLAIGLNLNRAASKIDFRIGLEEIP